VRFNYSLKEINCKIVYYGPGLGGKTANLNYIFERTPPEVRGKMIKLNTQTERTLFFDFLPLNFKELKGARPTPRTRFHLFTVPGQVFYQSSRRLILKDADGVVFVADSQEDRMDANEEAMRDLRDNLLEMHSDIERIPLVMQWNKRDLPDAVPVHELSARLNPLGRQEFLACATQGQGVFETLRAIAKLVIADFSKNTR
jgi:signal recognition particle receptor subunit beta